MADRWIYKILQNCNEVGLDLLGANGWELVHVVHTSVVGLMAPRARRENGIRTFYFKRKVQFMENEIIQRANSQSLEIVSKVVKNEVFNDKLLEMIKNEVVKNVTNHVVENFTQEIVSKINMQAVANLALVRVADDIKEIFKKK